MKKPSSKNTRHETTAAWSVFQDVAFDLGVSSRQVAIVILFSEAQRKRTKVRKARLRIPLHGDRKPEHGPVKITRLRNGS